MYMGSKFYFIYRTTNLRNEKFYIGVHTTSNLNDGYLGSGKRFKNSLNYHGKENFKREILEYFNDSILMYNREREIVNEELLTNPKCLNLKVGGIGGFKFSQEHQIRASSIHVHKLKTDPEYEKRYSKSISKSCSGDKHRLYNKHHSDETKKKIGLANSKHQSGKGNSQFGTCWITNNVENKKIYKGDTIPKGWSLGRKIK